MPADDLREPEPTPESEYPAYVQSAEERKRWDYARAIAAEIFAGDAANVWQATRSIYQGEIPTGDAAGG